jgi:hypothetical protein
MTHFQSDSGNQDGFDDNEKGISDADIVGMGHTCGL